MYLIKNAFAKSPPASIAFVTNVSRILAIMKVYNVYLLCVGLLMVTTGFTYSRSGGITLAQTDTLTIPLGGNSWSTSPDTTAGKVTDNGITGWTKGDASFIAYVRFSQKGSLKLWLSLKVADGTSSIRVELLKQSKIVKCSGQEFADHYAGEWQITDTGYIAIKIFGIAKTGNTFADIKALKISGSAINGHTAFVKNNDGNFFYWGRRGPSVHLGYQVPAEIKPEWFYNEVTVPAGNDVLGSYFMACGFGEGYFGMQVNSPTERHILFSVWSPFETDDPKNIPANKRIIMLKKGAGVHTGEFGNEGSGGQSYLNYKWKAGQKYKFLICARPDTGNYTVYTAWFFAPEVGKWQLIASFKRPQTHTYLTHLHSFLENFEPEQGIITREVMFKNQWVADSLGNWTALNTAKFTIDNTGAKGYRMDYAGGVSGDSFYLKNCGFFNRSTPKNTLLLTKPVSLPPETNLKAIAAGL